MDVNPANARGTTAAPEPVADHPCPPDEGRIDQPLRVVLVVDDLGFGGAERQVVELANSMDPATIDVCVCALSEHVPLSRTLRDAEHRLHTIAARGRFDLTVVARLARLLKARHADIVHGFLFRAEIVSRLAGRLAGTRVVIGSERNANYAIRRRWILAYRLTRSWADVIIANSHAGAEFNARIFGRPSSDYRVVHNGVDTERFQPGDRQAMRAKLAVPAEGLLVGAFANFKKQKNHALLLRAFQQVLGTFPAARLLLVGERPVDCRDTLGGYQTQLDRLIDALGIRPQCLFLGHRDDVEHLYPACDITVLSSLHEGTPNVLLESMACGIPVVATNVCDNKYIVKDGAVGYLVEVGDVAGMASRMQRLLGDPGLRGEMGKTARAWVLRQFSRQQLGATMEKTYREFLREKRE